MMWWNDPIEVLKAVEWIAFLDKCPRDELPYGMTWRCPWCYASREQGHRYNCPRQLAIAKLKVETPTHAQP
jgi:hypothetical protein